MKPRAKKVITIRLKYDGTEEVLLVKQAALKRGLSFNLFQRLVCLETAKVVLAASHEPILARLLNSTVAENNPS